MRTAHGGPARTAFARTVATGGIALPTLLALAALIPIEILRGIKWFLVTSLGGGARTDMAVARSVREGGVPLPLQGEMSYQERQGPDNAGGYTGD